MAGSATFITEPSMNARLDPKIVAVSVARGWRLGQGVALAPKAASQGLKIPAIAPAPGLGNPLRTSDTHVSTIGKIDEPIAALLVGESGSA
jgi:hypothetical protein